MSWSLLTLDVTYEHDVVAARQRARQITALLGFDVQDQTRVATAVSEIARNAFRYAGGGKVEFVVEGRTAPQLLLVRISDHGPGIRDLERVLDGSYRSATGMGLGIVGARRLMDRFDIETEPARGTTVWLRKIFPARQSVVAAGELAEVSTALGRQRPETPLEEVQRQSQELLRTLEELQRRQEELTRLNQELADTNRGVVALYAELDEKADHLRRADEMKSRFLSNMSHEFRTPLNSILALSRLLLEFTDGPLTDAQKTQVGYIRKAASDLSDLVNDLLDLAKVEAGKVIVRPVEFEVTNLFGALRGMLRPLLVTEAVALVFEEPEAMPPLFTDEAKVSQILRNFISNALKFTERGEVRVSATLDPGGDAVVFSVADSGIGIAPEDQERIFEEFSQLDHPIQKRVKGTGLGLPLTKKLAALLGGTVWVTSTPGAGSTFSVVIPRHDVEPAPLLGPHDRAVEPGRLPVLVVEDRAEDALVYEGFLRASRFQPIHARSLREARHVLATVRPRVIILDILLRGENARGFLATLERDERTRAIPIIVATTVEDQQKGLALGANAYGVKPITREWLLDALAMVSGTVRPCRVLVVDDDEISRYLLRSVLAEARCTVHEAANGQDGLERAIDKRPDVIFLDLIMPDVTGFEVLERLKAEPRTRDIPVIVFTSKPLAGDERAWLEERAVAVLSKEAASRQAGSEVLDALGLAALASGGAS
ncbi:MAG: response regulator [Candidatus Rokubacteria bacterium]|nr:response regulator [Candidatus Rokubacteria bacterium]